jgi:hypothetical protein
MGHSTRQYKRLALHICTRAPPFIMEAEEQPRLITCILSRPPPTQDVQQAHKMQIPTGTRPLLIGTGGRNIGLVAKYAQVSLECQREGVVQIIPRTPSESSVVLASSMVRSIVAGGILRWFTRPTITLRYYHPSVRPQLEALVVELTHSRCCLKLLRAPNGHLCLFVMPMQQEEETADFAEEIRAARPLLLAKIKELSAAQPPPPTEQVP